MIITTKFDLGQTVWALWNTRAERLVNCECCGNTGKVNITGKDYVCPQCHGAGQHKVYDGDRWYVQTSGRVGKVEPELYEHEDESSHKNRVNYMLDSTGVGSGTVWREDNLAASHDEAKAECDRRNAVLLGDETKL
jgi:hypothetical protein